MYLWRAADAARKTKGPSEGRERLGSLRFVPVWKVAFRKHPSGTMPVREELVRVIAIAIKDNGTIETGLPQEDRLPSIRSR